MLTSSFASAFVFEVASDFSRTNLMDRAVPLAKCPQLGTESSSLPGFTSRLSPEGVICDDTCMTAASENRCKKGKKIVCKEKKAKMSKRSVIR